MSLTQTTAEKSALMELAAVQGRSLWDDAFARLKRNRAAMASIFLLVLLTLLAFLGPLFWPHSFDEIYRDRVAIAPTFDNMHWLGTDMIGRDMVARLMYGLQISLSVGVLATLVSLVIGVTWGAVAGFAGGRVDQIMMRFVDVMYALPFIFFVILLTVAFGRNIFLIFIAIGAVEWLTMARIVRGQTLALRKREFVEAARASGVTPLAIVFRHIVPNVLGPVVVYVTLMIPVVILAESFLSFLGLGVNEPLTSLGRLIAIGQDNMERPWLLFVPAITMMVTLFAFNFIGDGVRDALDPKDR
jgi:oligopeptide transport system permease protein